MPHRNKILLVTCPYDPGQKRCHEVRNLPMGILVLGTLLKHAGFDVQLFDCVFVADYERKLVDAAEGALFVGFSVMTNQIACTLETARLLKRYFPRLPLVWGGIHPTLEPVATLAVDCCDIVVPGEADNVIVALAEALQEGRSLEKVPGVIFSSGGKIVETPPSPLLENLDRLPRLDIDLLDTDNYFDLDFDKKWGGFEDKPGSVRRLTLQSARGCPFHCRFCINSIIRNHTGANRYRTMSPRRLIDDILYYRDHYNINFISFGDDLFFSDRKRVFEIVKLIRRHAPDIKWYANVRADFFGPHYIDDAFVHALEAAGCIRLALGIESGSQVVLDYLQKKITVPQVARAVTTIARSGIVAGYSFMMGLPKETAEDRYRTLALIHCILESAPRSYIIGPQLYRPYPGSALFNDCVEGGWRQPETLEAWCDNLTASGCLDISAMHWVADPAGLSEALSLATAVILNRDASGVRRLAPGVVEAFERLFEELREGGGDV